MKAILPILICSVITGGLGYYFGHITVPASKEVNGTSDATVASAPKPAPVNPPAPAYVAPQPAPVAAEPSTPTPAPTEVATPTAEEAAFAERAALPIQTLTDNQGRSMQANILEVTTSNVKIRRSDGLETTIPLSMLRADDVAFCNYLREQKSSRGESPPAIKADEFDWDAYFNS